MMAIGALLFILGASAIDSPNMAIPAMMTIIGLLIMLIGSRNEKWS